jgi:hypothetical protein
VAAKTHKKKEIEGSQKEEESDDTEESVKEQNEVKEIYKLIDSEEVRLGEILINDFP